MQYLSVFEQRVLPDLSICFTLATPASKKRLVNYLKFSKPWHFLVTSFMITEFESLM